MARRIAPFGDSNEQAQELLSLFSSLVRKRMRASTPRRDPGPRRALSSTMRSALATDRIAERLAQLTPAALVEREVREAQMHVVIVETTDGRAFSECAADLRDRACRYRRPQRRRQVGPRGVL